MDVAEEIRKLTASLLAEDQFLVDVIVSSKQGPRKVLVAVDGDRGVGIDDVGEISRRLSKLMDEQGVIDDHYTLEVSTPGVDHPLKLWRQYRKNIGRKLKVKLQDKVIEGALVAVDDDNIVLRQETGLGKHRETSELNIPFAEIEKAFVLVSFK